MILSSLFKDQSENDLRVNEVPPPPGENSWGYIKVKSCKMYTMLPGKQILRVVVEEAKEGNIFKAYCEGILPFSTPWKWSINSLAVDCVSSKNGYFKHAQFMKIYR